MNMQTDIRFSPSLQEHAEALTASMPDDATAAAAQERLLARIATVPRPTRTAPSRMLGATAAACAVLVLGAVVFFGNLAAPGGGLAFADVQRQLAEFEAMTMQMVQAHQGTAIQRTRVTTVRDGRTRVDVGDQVSVIVDPTGGTATTLLHGPRQALTMELPTAGVPQADEALAWLEELRTFQGEALQLPQTRVIDGQQAHGWALEVQAMDIVLWATADGVPLEMALSGPGGLMMDFSFDFDPQIAPELLDTAVPAGYRAMH